MKRINIIVWDNGAGLSRDRDILYDILTDAGFQVTINGYSSCPKKVRHLTYDVNIFIECLHHEWFWHAHVNVLIPNPEWFQDKWHPDLTRLDRVLCKTEDAQKTFDELGCKTEFISFSSVDRLDDKYEKSYEKYFHLAGRSTQKGTRPLIELWSRYPEWPTLTIVQNPETAEVTSVDNIRHIVKYVDDTLLQFYQNVHGVHLCPSESEGYGHYIGEALSCGALTVTTNAPPMNELVTAERGILIDYHASNPKNLGTNYYVDVEDMERKVKQVLSMDISVKKQLGENARKWYEQNNQFFRGRIVEIMENL